MDIVGKIKQFFLDDTKKALLDIDSSVDVDSTKIAGKGQIGKFIAKSSKVAIDNSTHNHFHINLPDNINPEMEEFSKIQEEIKKQFANGNVQFLAEQSDGIIIGYKDFERNSSYIETINFFRGKVSSADFQFLRTGLYVRYLVDNNRKDEALRIKDNAIRNNQRARNIINLASDGYFEEYIKPIYDSNDEEVFKIEYEEVVNYLPEIVFVNNSMDVKKIMKEVEGKLMRSEQYHLQVKCITVNGLNQSVDIIRKSEPEIRKKYPDCKINLQTDGSSGTSLRGKMRIELPVLSK